MGDILGTIGSALLEVVLPALATAIGGMLIGLLRKQAKKVGLEITKEQEEQLQKIALDAVKAAEEAARRRAKSGDPMTSAEKDAAARTIAVTRVLESNTLPDTVTEEKLRTMIDAALPEARAFTEMGQS